MLIQTFPGRGAIQLSPLQVIRSIPAASASAQQVSEFLYTAAELSR